MIKRLVYTSIISASLLISGSLLASPKKWGESPSYSSSVILEELTSSKDTQIHSRKIKLDITSLAKQLGQGVGLKSQKRASSTVSSVIEIPLPDGNSLRVKAEKVSVMAPELERQFPQIKTWRVTGENDASIHGVIDITEHGFHAMVTMPDGDIVFIEPDKQNHDQYLSFSRRANLAHFNNKPKCEVHSEHGIINKLFSKEKKGSARQSSSARGAWETLTYRLAVAATGEYTQKHGGTKSGALSAINTTISRVNEIYREDVSIQFELVDDELDIIYTNPDTDPYTNNNSDLLIDENILNLSSSKALSESKYDIGHVFGTQSGLAYLSSVCGGTKAGGTTGLSNPQGDAFDIDFVAHEIGHQLGATHTFNSSCGGNREPQTAYEPGSGSTIMAYAGICDANNLQQNSDPQFSLNSIAQIEYNTREVENCGRLDQNTNSDPEVEAGNDYSIPSSTPFALAAKGTDPDGDTLTYTWEQDDVGSVSPVDVDTGNNAYIRSRPKSTSPVRYIPRRSDLANGISVKGEHLVATDRKMEFYVTARDGKGGTNFDNMNVTFVGTGRPFSITSHRNAETLIKGASTRIEWDVAGTDDAPISCAKVNIWLIQPSGNDIKLIETANDGQEQVMIPTNSPDFENGRVLINCSSNIFFNISTGSLKVTSSTDVASSSGGGSTSYIFLLFLLAFGVRQVRGGKQ